MNAYKSLEAYRAAKVAATDAKKAANAVIATEGSHELPEHCDREAILKMFAQLARSNKNSRAIVDGLDGAKIYADAEAKRSEKREAKRKAEAEAFEAALNERINALLDAELSDAIAATTSAQSDNVEATA